MRISECSEGGQLGGSCMIVWMREESRGGEEGWTHVLEVKSTGFADGLNAGGTGKKKLKGTSQDFG